MHRRYVHLLVFYPLHIVMLERFAFREDEFNRPERDRIIWIIGVFRNQTGELASFNEFFEKRAPEFLNLMGGLNLELLHILTTRLASDTNTSISVRRFNQHGET